jgi:hypothetical protein
LTRRRTARALIAASLFISAFSLQASVQHRVEQGTLAPLSAPTMVGGRMKIANVPLVDGKPETLELERFEVWAPGADIKVFGANGEVVESLQPPATQYFRGSVAGMPDSIVFLAKTGPVVEGLIYAQEKKFAIGSVRTSRRSVATEVVVQESSFTDDYPVDGGFTCDLEKAAVQVADRPRAATNALGEPVSQAAPAGTQRSVINLAVETDYELYVNAGSSTANVTTFIGNLIGAVSTIYQRDLLTEVRVSSLTMQSNIADPFTKVPGGGATTLDALLEFGARWHNTPPSANPRSAAALISGKSQGAGIAWMDVLCSGDFQYGAGYGGPYSYNGGIDPPASLAVPNPDANADYGAPSSNYWPLMQVSHELGHNVGSNHTHCVAMSDAQATSYGKPTSQNFVDSCYGGESGCYSGTTSVPSEKGSIMSYCHLNGGGAATRFTFGLPNEPSEIIRNNMRGYLAAVTPSGLSAITAPASLAAGASATASVTNAAGLTYAWTISGGTINGSSTGASINFTANTNPVTVRVTATNSFGCSITDHRNVTVGAVLAAPTNVVATAQSTTSVLVTWSPSVNAATYTVWRSADGTSYSPVSPALEGTTWTDTSALPNKGYKYAVHAANATSSSGLSSGDLAVTVIFTDATLAGLPMKALHLSQLRTAVEAVQAMKGTYLDPWIDPSLTGVVAKADHITQLRSATIYVRTAVGMSPTTFATDYPLDAGTPIKAAHIVEIRNMLR